MKTPSSTVLYSICYLSVALTSYQGKLNPYQSGLLDTAATATLLVGLVFLAGAISIRLQKFLHIALLLSFAFITFASWFYFDYFQSLFTLSILSLGADLGAGSKALSFQPYGWTIVIVSSVCLLCTILGCFAHHSSKKSSLVSGLVLILIASIGLAIIESSIATYQKRQVPWLHPDNLHPLHAIFMQEATLDSNDQDAADAYQYFKSLNTSDKNAIQPLMQISHGANKYNLIIILLESFRADFVGTYNLSSNKHTPSFDAIASQNIVAQNYYSNTTHTVSAELSIWCGIFDLHGDEKLAYQSESLIGLDCLPTILAKNGYHSSYFHANKASFYNRTEFIPKIGFSSSYFHEDQIKKNQDATKVGWGLSDENMFDIFFSKLTEQQTISEQPFFAHLTTLSNHYPFNWDFPIDKDLLPFPLPADQNTIFENYQNGVFYTDYALGKFWQKFTQSPLSENTVVVISSDHGIWKFDESQKLSLADKNEKFYRAPLVIYHPGIEKATTIEQVASHIDLPPTILPLLGIETSSNYFLGKNLNDNNSVDKSWAIMNKRVNHILRKHNKVCYYNADQCNGIQQNCAAWRGDIVFDTQQAPLIKCQAIDGELSVNEAKDIELEFLQARNVIQYHNGIRRNADDSEF